MDDKSLPYNLRLRKDHKASAAPSEPSKHQKQERDFQVMGGEELCGGGVVVHYRCEKCGCSFDLESSLRSHHCKNKSEKEHMENQVEENVGDINKSLRRRKRKGIPRRSPFF